MPPEPAPSAEPKDSKAQNATVASAVIPPMSREQILAGKVLTDSQGLNAGQLVSFVLLEKVAEGGMGIVYRAQQDLPRRIVALKVMKAAAATPQTLRRFEREVAILAQLQDAAIAQLYSVGEVATGISGTMPFLAMEYVHGSPITHFAVVHKLDTCAKLELMVRICDGVAYAHRCGVIHRDLKPSNILVTRSGQPKILDFGLATITDASRPRDYTLTEAGQPLGTVEYMSPEQAGGQSHSVDQRSDVYALGVVLFELLTGRRPADFSSCTLMEALEQIQSAPNMSLASVNRSYRGDLDVLVSKTLAKDKTQRYASAQDLADELRRYLRHEPIQARRPTLTYRLRKYIRRNRVLVTSSSAIVLTLTLGLIGTVRESHRANLEAAKARTQADRAETEARHARLQFAQATLAGGDALLALEKFDAARSAYNTAWDVQTELNQPTRNVELAIWELDHRTGRPIRVLAEANQPVSCAAFSTDQKLLALGFESGLVQVRNVWNDKVQIETNLGGIVHQALFSPSRRYFLTGNDRGCELWDLQQGRKLGSRTLDGARQTLAVMNDERVALCDDRGRFYCAPIGQFLQTEPIDIPLRDIQSLRLVGNDAYLLVDQTRVLRCSGQHLEELASHSLSGYQHIELSPNGQGILALGKASSVLHLPQLQPTPIAGYEGAVSGGWVNASLLWLVNPNGQTLDYVNLDGSVVARVPFAKSTVPVACAGQFVILPNAQRQTMLRAVQLPRALRMLASVAEQPVTGTLSQDGLIAAVAFKDGRVRLLDSQGGRPLGELFLGSPARLLKFDEQTLRLVAITDDNIIQIWNVPQLKKESDIPLANSVQAWDLSPSGKRCCFSLDGQGGTWTLNLDSLNAQPVRLPVAFAISGIAAASEDQWFLAGGGNCELWHVGDQPRRIAQFNVGDGGAERIAFWRPSSLLLTEIAPKTLRLWHRTAGDLQVQPLHGIPRTFLSWSLAGSSLVVRENDALTFFDLSADCVERHLIWPRDLGRPLAFSANGRHLLSLSPAGVAAMNWEVPNFLRSFETSRDALSRARWFSAAGLSSILETYPPTFDSSPPCLADAYGAWALGDNQKARPGFADSSELTPGTKSLLLRATSVPTKKD